MRDKTIPLIEDGVFLNLNQEIRYAFEIDENLLQCDSPRLNFVVNTTAQR